MDDVAAQDLASAEVLVTDDDISDEFQGWWSLFLVSQERGHSYGHYFLKYVLIHSAGHPRLRQARL